MSYLNQKTINKKVSFSGITLHSGLDVNVSIHPAEPNFGIVLRNKSRCEFEKNAFST